MGERDSRPFVIGITGNIGTGKSTVASMLADLGAEVIDADKVAHRVMQPGTSVHAAIVEAFGRDILTGSEEIDRDRLGSIVFGDPRALARLEAIVHPATLERIEDRIASSSSDVVVVEAIKLLESGLAHRCDGVWVTTCRRDQQIERVIRERDLSRSEARRRVEAQGSPAEKVARADVVIDNTGDLSVTRAQVRAAWDQLVGELGEKARAAWNQTRVEYNRRAASVRGGQGGRETMAGGADILVRRAQARDVERIAGFVNRALGGDVEIEAETVLSRLGDVAFFLAQREGKAVGMIGWRVENLVARVTDLLIWPSSEREDVGQALFREMESGARGLQAEAAVLFVPRSGGPELVEFAGTLGYEAQVVGEMPRAWRETAHEAGRGDEDEILVKQLRSQRVVSPL